MCVFKNIYLPFLCIQKVISFISFKNNMTYINLTYVNNMIYVCKLYELYELCNLY